MSCNLVRSYQQREGGLAQARDGSPHVKGSWVSLGQPAAAPSLPPKPPCIALVSLLASLFFNIIITNVSQFLISHFVLRRMCELFKWDQ